MYKLCSDNKGADQLHGYREADLRLCFHICKKPVFSRLASNIVEFGTARVNVFYKMINQMGLSKENMSLSRRVNLDQT